MTEDIFRKLAFDKNLFAKCKGWHCNEGSSINLGFELIQVNNNKEFY